MEDIKAGDQISNIDGELKTVIWTGSRKCHTSELDVDPHLKPVRIRAGAFGDGVPEKDLLVSRQHRLLIRSKVVQRIFGIEEVLAPAIKLVGMDGIEIAEDLKDVTYFHILFQQHEIVCANGAWTESLFTGPEALKSLSNQARREIEELLPEIRQEGFEPAPARPIADKGKLIKKLVARHVKNQIPLFGVS